MKVEKTATAVCRINAGFANQNLLDNTQVNLQNPQLYPLVVKYIGELREEWQKKYEVTYDRHICRVK
jgi:hypothetical protein